MILSAGLEAHVDKIKDIGISGFTPDAETQQLLQGNLLSLAQQNYKMNKNKGLPDHGERDGRLEQKIG